MDLLPMMKHIIGRFVNTAVIRIILLEIYIFNPYLFCCTLRHGLSLKCIVDNTQVNIHAQFILI